MAFLTIGTVLIDRNSRHVNLHSIFRGLLCNSE